MTKQEAIQKFKNLIFPGVLKSEAGGSGRPDYPARSEAWGIFTDALCKDGRITLRQYKSWMTPSFCNKSKKKGKQA